MAKQLLTRITLTLALSGLATAAAPAADGIKIGAPTYAGTGCPTGSAKTSTDGGNTVLTLQQFVLRPKGGGAIARMTCNVSIPVQVESGYQIALRALTLTGQARLSADAKARVSTELFFAGTRGKRAAESLPSGNSGLRVSNRLSESELHWSACGAQPIARANTDITLQAKSQTDSIRADTLTLELQSRKCP